MKNRKTKKRTDHQWIYAFKALANINRLRIVLLLLEHKKRNHSKEGIAVGDLARDLGITIASTSRNLRQLSDVGIVHNQGKMGHVFYFLAPDIPTDILRVIVEMYKTVKRTHR